MADLFLAQLASAASARQTLEMQAAEAAQTLKAAEKADRRKERNRQSAASSRKRQSEYRCQLEEQNQMLREENKRLRAMVEGLNDELSSLRSARAVTISVPAPLPSAPVAPEEGGTPSPLQQENEQQTLCATTPLRVLTPSVAQPVPMADLLCHSPRSALASPRIGRGL